MSNKTRILIGLLMTIFVSVNGHTDKKVIEDARLYLDSWTNYMASDTLDLVKNWSTPKICVISFEKGLYTVSDEHAQTKEKGKWEIKRIDNQDLIIIKVDSGQTIKFKILTVDNKKLRLKRVT
jgi:hypothetical protein